MDNNHPQYHVFPTEFGWMGVVVTEGGVFASVLPQSSREEAESQLLKKLPFVPEFSPDCLKWMEDRLRAYFTGGSNNFGFEIDWSWATSFQRKVLEEVSSIPAGSCLTYGQVALLLGSPKAARAVGTALANNNIPVIIPCHRVIGKNGLGGFTGGGLDLKLRLLSLEECDIEIKKT
ncbi:MAG TPA: methylated-DNA--[protein]-cysteine S-methyltransferase [Desulfobacteria bacterium]|nr:methylated-DNA--[protein]-cysteine S-methyltransferase [Desulfobacteria bacterium]